MGAGDIQSECVSLESLNKPLKIILKKKADLMFGTKLVQIGLETTVHSRGGE